MTVPADDRLQARNDLAWAISVGGIGVVLFAALLLFTWYFAATLFLIFAGMLLGVGAQRHDQPARTCRPPAACAAADHRLPGAGGHAVGRRLPRRRHHRPAGHRAEQHASSRSSSTSRRSWRKTASTPASSISAACHRTSDASDAGGARRRADPQSLPSAGTIASSGGAIFSQTLKLLLGTVQRGRKLLHRAVSGYRLRRPAKRLPRRAAVHRAGETSRRARP